MSMLAERKVKQRWSLNPRGNTWSDDSNKFGQKMLEKMGWSKGKGLGAKEDGITEHVKLSYKNDSKGMGYKDSNDQWTEHETNFSALLKSLTGDKPIETTQIASLEEKSQKSRVRVHYKKFTRGKDLSRCSAKDLANIFGRKSLEPVAPSAGDGESKNEEVEDRFRRNGGSMVDYFKKKLPNFGRSNGYVIGSNGVLKCPSETENDSADEKKKNDECGHRSFDNLDDGRDCQNGDFEVKKKKKKTKRNEETGTGIEDLVGNDVVKSQSERESDPSEDRKKKKNKNDESVGIENPNFDNLCDDHSCQKADFEVKRKKKKTKKSEGTETEIENPISNGVSFEETSKKEEESSSLDNSEVKKKKKKNKNNESVGIENPNFDNFDDDRSCQNGDFEVKRKKTKNKNEETVTGIENPTFDEAAIGDDCHNDDFEVKRKKNKRKSEDPGESYDIEVKKKKKKRKTEEASFDDSGSCQDFELKRKKTKKNGDGFEVGKRKRKKREDESLAIDNPNFDSISDCQNSYVDSNFEVKRKKKRKNEDSSFAIDNPNFDSTEGGQSGRVNDNFEVRRKKKKSEDTSLAIDNPNFDSNDDCQNSYVDGNFEVKRKKKKGEDTSLAIDNPNFDSNDDRQNSYVDGNFEVKRKKKKSEDTSLAIDNPIFDSTEDASNGYVAGNSEVKRTKNDTEDLALVNPTFEDSAQKEENRQTQTVGDDKAFDLMLNITSIPCPPKPAKLQKRNRRKIVRFSNVNEERIIPNNDDLANNSRIIEEGLDAMSKKIDGLQAEVENDMNHAKVNRFIGEVGDPNGRNEKLPDGTTKLKFKYAKFGRMPQYPNKDTSRAQTSYKHLIKGDIILGFNNTNLHEVLGYATLTQRRRKRK